MLEYYTTEEQRLLFFIWWAKGLNAEDIHKGIFPVSCGKCLSRKAVQNWVANLSLTMKILK
jgi:hypothetical protein